ncbi:MAG: hypothetical protein KF754_15290 [Planctomycetes bacterium]|nr:hypothetical protein [Planctomycetota bacterium]
MFLCSSQLKHHVVASSRGRYALNSIALTRRGVISTDGHSLVLAPYPEADPAEAPMIEGVNPASPPATPDSTTAPGQTSSYDTTDGA